MCVCAQDTTLASIFPFKDSKVYYEKIVRVDSVPKTPYSTDQKFGHYHDSTQIKDALQIEDKESGLLFYNGILSIAFVEPPNIGGGYSIFLSNYNFLRINLLANFSATKIVNFNYTIDVTGKPQSTGTYSSNLSYIGLSINYIFTGTNKRLLKLYEKNMN